MKKVKISELIQPVSTQVQPKDFGEVIYVGLEHIRSGDITLRDNGISDQVKSTKWKFQAGDILYGKLRPYLNKCAVSDKEGICSTDILVLRPKEDVYPKYIAYALSGKSFVDFSNSTVSGMNLPRTTWSKINHYELFVPFKNGNPDLAEQQRIADRLDSLFKTMEQGEEKMKRSNALANALFESYLNNFFDIKNKEGFQETELGSLCAIAGGSGFPHSHQGRKTEKYPFYKVGDMNTKGNEVYMKKHNHSISDKDVKSLKVKIYPAGTIIFPKIGGAIATNKKRILSVPSAVDNNVMALAPNKDVCPEYLYSYFLNFNLSDWANKSALPSIRKSDVEKTLVPIPMKDKNPDYSLQKQLAENIKTFQEKTLSISHLSKKSLETLGRFRQSVLSDAFFHST